MADLIRDTVFGHFVRLITKGRYLPYAEERDPELWKRYIHYEKTGQMARHGRLGPLPTNHRRETESNESSQTRASENQPTNVLSGHKIDQEKGRDVNIVDWYSNTDPEVSCTRGGFYIHSMLFKCMKASKR